MRRGVDHQRPEIERPAIFEAFSVKLRNTSGVDAADRVDLVFGDGLLVGDDRKHFHGGGSEPGGWVFTILRSTFDMCGLVRSGSERKLGDLDAADVAVELSLRRAMSVR